jgi:hypothetical protein
MKHNLTTCHRKLLLDSNTAINLKLTGLKLIKSWCYHGEVVTSSQIISCINLEQKSNISETLPVTTIHWVNFIKLITVVAHLFSLKMSFSFTSFKLILKQAAGHKKIQHTVKWYTPYWILLACLVFTRNCVYYLYLTDHIHKTLPTVQQI